MVRPVLFAASWLPLAATGKKIIQSVSLMGKCLRHCNHDRGEELGAVDLKLRVIREVVIGEGLEDRESPGSRVVCVADLQDLIMIDLIAIPIEIEKHVHQIILRRQDG